MLYSFLGISERQDYLVRDLGTEWMVYSSKNQGYIPCLDNKVNNYKALTIFVNLDSYTTYYLQFEAKKGLNLFVNNRFLERFDRDSIINIPIKKILQKTKGKTKLTFYHIEKHLPFNNIAIVRLNKHGLTIGNKGKNDSKEIKGIVRPVPKNKNLLNVSFLFLITAITYLKRSKKVLLDAYFNIVKLFDRSQPDNYVLYNSLNITTIILLLVTSFSISVVISSVELGIPWLNFSGLQATAGMRVVDHILLTLLFFAAFLLKYYFLLILSNFLNLSQYYRVHFYEFTRAVILGALIILILCLVCEYYFWNTKEIIAVSVFLWAIFWNLRIAWVCLKLVKLRNLYFFFYLCCSEILPIILILGQLVSY